MHTKDVSIIDDFHLYNSKMDINNVFTYFPNMNLSCISGMMPIFNLTFVIWVKNCQHWLHSLMLRSILIQKTSKVVVSQLKSCLDFFP